MKANETKLQMIIEGTKQFVVPLFQRPYSWEQKHWDVLWDDLLDLCEEDQPRNHFMGSIVTMPAISVPEGVTKYVLIDGQQRLTTILLILALIRDNAKNLPGTLANQIEDLLLLNRYQEGTDIYKLLPTQADRDSFMSIMKGDSPVDGTQLGKACRYFTTKLRTTPALDLDKLRRVIVRDLLLVSIVLDPDDNPHLIFESLNAKGRPLTQADLIRNYFFMRIHPDQQAAIYSAHWNPMQDRLGNDLTEFIRHFLMKEGVVVKQGDVFLTLKERSDHESQDQVIPYLKELCEFSGYYERLLHPEREPDVALRERLERLLRIEVTTAYPFLLNVYRDYSRGVITKVQFGEILDLLENFMVRRFICGVPTNTLNKLFPPLYVQAKAQSNLVEGVKAYLASKNYPKDAEFIENFATARLYGGDRGIRGRMILERLESFHGHHETVDFAGLTIEHVMPQTLTTSWKNELGDSWEEAHGRLKDTIGNLTLSGYNPELSNDDFQTKRNLLNSSHLELNKYFVHVDRWNEQAILERAKALSSMALSIWSYFGPKQELPEEEPTESLDGGDDEAFDLPRVLSLLGGGSLISGDSRVRLYRFSDGKKAVFRYSKLYPRPNHFWYGLRPAVIEYLGEIDNSYVTFVMGRHAAAIVPLELVREYCKGTKSSLNTDGTIIHYQVRISNEEEPYLFWSQESPRYPLLQYLIRFDQSTL